MNPLSLVPLPGACRICLRGLKYFNSLPSLTHNFLDNLIGGGRPALDWVASPRGSGARNHGDRNRVHVRNVSTSKKERPVLSLSYA